MPPKSAKLRHYSLSRQNSVKFCKYFTQDRVFFTPTLLACLYVFASLSHPPNKIWYVCPEPNAANSAPGSIVTLHCSPSFYIDPREVRALWHCLHRPYPEVSERAREFLQRSISQLIPCVTWSHAPLLTSSLGCQESRWTGNETFTHGRLGYGTRLDLYG